MSIQERERKRERERERKRERGRRKGKGIRGDTPGRSDSNGFEHIPNQRKRKKNIS